MKDSEMILAGARAKYEQMKMDVRDFVRNQDIPTLTGMIQNYGEISSEQFAPAEKRVMAKMAATMLYKLIIENIHEINDGAE